MNTNQVKTIASTKLKDTTLLPAFIAFDSLKKMFTFTPTMSTTVKDYQILLTVGYGPTTGKENTFDTDFTLSIL